MSYPLDSELLRTFLFVAEQGNFTRAADRVRRTQSAVSMQIQKLEAILETSLFTRGPRGVELTKEGQRLLPHARSIVRMTDETAAVMRAVKLEGQVRIGFPHEYTTTILPRVIAAFSELYPDIEVTTYCGYSSQQTAALEKDELDIAILFDPKDLMDGTFLAVDPTFWVTSTTHNQHLRSPIPIAIYWRSTWCRDYAIANLKQHGIAYRQAYSCDTAGALTAAASAGIAIAPLAASAIPPDCRKLTEEDGFSQIDTSRVVMRCNPRTINPAIRAMADAIEKAFQPMFLNQKAPF
ncbi:LysR family transcriptional regulator [Rhizobium sp. L1K21]|uniref:LysR family transcriptional regulator n=1 Tax=Rhizobium sp. L1K21 TaxID=2954933 RepID=UPI0020928E0E|nr:LysR family transcriptional regulator [Rhizobium sp. L1K21]MCO6185710.1 LysR family transcriptional regulator [Rhizobium sp. L1K21]